MNLAKTISLILIPLTILMLTLFVLRKVSDIFFWVYMGLTGIIAYWIIPKLRK